MLFNSVAIAPASAAAQGGKANAGGRAGGAEQAHAFGTMMDNALLRHSAEVTGTHASQPNASEKSQAASPIAAKHAPTVDEAKAHDDNSSRDDDKPAEASQLDGRLQAFVDGLQTPVTAMTVPAPAAATTGDTAASSTLEQTGGLASLAADAMGKDTVQSVAFSARDHSRLSAATDAGSADDFKTESGAESGDKLKAEFSTELSSNASDAANTRASQRAGVAPAGSTASEVRASSDNAPMLKPALAESLFSETVNGTGSPQAFAAASAAAGTSPVNLANASATAVAYLAAPLHASQWPEGFGQHMLWMARNEHQMASLSLNPPDLGPVRVTLSIADGQASASFISLQPEVRQAIQDAVPRLKELFADVGLPLQQASVGSGDAGAGNREHKAAMQMRAESGHEARTTQGRAHTDDAAAIANGASRHDTRSLAELRLVDLFA